MVFEETFVVTLTMPETVAPEAGEAMETVGGPVTVFFTVNRDGGAGGGLPIRVAGDSDERVGGVGKRRGVQRKTEGRCRHGGAGIVPSTLNCTLVVFAETFVVTATVPETVAPEAGEVMETVGARRCCSR